jgi:hypothetical protein
MANLKIPKPHLWWWLLRDFVPSGSGLLFTLSGARPGGPCIHGLLRSAAHQRLGLLLEME